MMRKFAFVLSGLAALAITLFVSSTSAIEEPSYSLVAAWDDPEVEIRDYDANERGTEFRISSVGRLYLRWQRKGAGDCDDSACSAHDAR